METVTEEQIEEVTDEVHTNSEETSMNEPGTSLQLIEKAKAVAGATESKTIKYNTCLSDDQDSDTIKFEDVVNDSEATTKRKHHLSLNNQKLKESQSSCSAGVLISSTEMVGAEEEEKKQETQNDNSDEVRTTREGHDSRGSGNPKNGSKEQETRRLDVGGRDSSRRLCASNEFENEEKRDLQ